MQMSTIGERATERCIELAREHGVGFVDAPVLGTQQPAAEGKLVVLASGPDELRERVQPVFDAVGQRTMWVGEAGAGSRLKLVTNAWIVAVVEGVAESIALAEGLGLDPALFLEAIEGGPLDAPYVRMKGQAMIERDFAPTLRAAPGDEGRAARRRGGARAWARPAGARRDRQAHAAGRGRAWRRGSQRDVSEQRALRATLACMAKAGGAARWRVDRTGDRPGGRWPSLQSC